MKKLLTILGAVVMFATGEAWGANHTFALAGSPAAGELPANTSEIFVFRGSVTTANNTAITVNSIQFSAGGTAVVPTEVDQVKLYEDTDANGAFDVGVDVPLGTAQTFVSGNNTVNFSGLNWAIAKRTTKYFLVLVRTTSNVTVGHTFTLGIAAATAIDITAGQTVVGTFPLTSSAFTVWGLGASLGATTPAGDSMATDRVYLKSVFQFSLTATGETVNVNSITITSAGSVTSSDVNQVSLYGDANANGIYDAGETLLGSTQSFAGTMTFTGSPLVAVTTATPVNIVAVARATGNATAGRTLSLSLAANGDVSGTGATTSLSRPSQGTATSNTMTFSSGDGVLTVSAGTSPPSAGVMAKSTSDIGVFHFKLSAAVEQINITSVKLTKGGTASVPTELDLVTLYKDKNNNGLLDVGTDSLIGQQELGATNTFSGVTETRVPAGGSIQFIAVVRTTANGVAGNTVTLSIAAGDVVGTGSTSGHTINSLGTAVSNAKTFSKLGVEIGANTPPSGLLAKKTTYSLLQAKLTAGAENINVSGVTVTVSGTATLPGQIASVSLYIDANNSGTFDTGETQLGVTTTAASTVTFSGTNFPLLVTAGGFVNVVATVKTANTALPAGVTCRLSIAADGDITGTGVTTGQSQSSVGTATGEQFHVANPNGVLGVEIGDTPPTGGAIQINTNDIEIFQFAFAGPGDAAASVSSITLTAGGTVVPSDEIAEVRLYQDLNQDGTLDANDGVALGTQSFAPSVTTVTFSSLTLSVPKNETVVMLAVVRTGAGGVSGHTFTLGLNATTDITATGGTVTFTPPLTSNTFTFPGYLTTALGANTAAADTMHTFNGAHLKSVFQFAVTAVGQDMNLTSVKLTAGGTAALPTEIAQISLYRDANNNGQYDVGETQRGTTQTAAGTVTFTISGLTITAGATERFVAVAHIPSDISAAANGKTFNLSIAAASDVAGANASGYYRASEGTATSNTMTFYDGTKGVLNVSNGTSNPGAGRLSNSATFEVFHLKLSPLGEAFDLSKSDLSYNKVAIKLGGTATFGSGQDIESMSLFDSDGSTPLGSPQTSATNGIVTFTWTSPEIQITSGGSRDLIVKVTTGNGAQGRTLTLSIPDTGYVVGRGVTSGKWIGSAGTASSATWSFSDLTVALGPYTPAAAVLNNSATKVSVLQVKLGAVAENVNIDGATNYLKVTLSGLAGTTGFGTQITGVTLWEDANNDGVADAQQLGATQISATDNVVTFSWTTPTTQITSGGFTYVVVAVNTGTGVAGNTLGLTVEAGQVQGTGASTGRTLYSTGSAVSNVFNFANPTDVVGVSRGNAPVSAGQITINQDNIPMIQLRLAGPGNKAATVTGITFTNTGTGWAGYETSQVRLYYDNNTDGQLDANDNLIDTRTFTNNTVAFTGLNIPLSQNGSRTVLAVLKTNANGISGNTLNLQLTTNAAVTAISSVTTALSETPLTSANKTFATGQVTVTKAAELAPSGVNPGDRNVALMRLNFTTSGPAVKISSIKVDNTYGVGTYDAADIDSVEIYRDGGDLSFSATGDLLVATSPVTGENGGSGTATFAAGIGDTLRASAVGVFYVVYDVATLAISTRQFGAKLASASYVTMGLGTVANVNFPIELGYERSLPVEFASFTAEAVGQAVKLAWATESETDNLYWIVERKEASATDATYVQIHRLNGMGSTPYRTDYEFVDRSVVPGTRYAYRLTDVSRYGVRKTHDPVEVTAGAALALGNAFPNPANPATVWAYSLPDEQMVRLAVYNTLGQQVRVLVNGRVGAGTHQARWDITDDTGRAMASGVYFAVMETPTSRLVSRVTVVR